MAVTVSIDPTFERFPNPSLPRDVQRFFGYGTVTGDVSAGDADMNPRMNPGSLADWQPFVALYDLRFSGVTADPTDATLYLIDPGWEEITASLTLDTLVTSAAINGEYVARLSSGPLYLGRARRSDPAVIRLKFPNVNTAVYRARFVGLVSQKPFVAYDYIRV